MKQVTITIETTNAAFEPDPQYEVARILREIAESLEYHNYYRPVRDLNGNIVGSIKITD